MPEYLVRNLCVLALLPGFTEVYKSYGLAVGQHAVEFFDSVDAHRGAPVGILPAGSLDLGKFYTHSISFKYGPVTEFASAETCSGVPVATILPPLRPPSGPMSMR